MNPENKQQEGKQKVFEKPWARSLGGVIAVLIVLAGFWFYRDRAGKIFIDDAEVSAPIIALSPQTSDVLEEIYVKEGDVVAAGAPLAKVGVEIVAAKTAGIVAHIDDRVGAIFNRGQAVVSMIDPEDFRIVGQIEEDKGLSDIVPGQPVAFTVDAFGGKEFTGIVDSISPTSNENGVAFSISDKRPTKKFDVSVRFDVAAHPEFKEGMSAKMRIYVR